MIKRASIEIARSYERPTKPARPPRLAVLRRDRGPVVSLATGAAQARGCLFPPAVRRPTTTCGAH